MNDEKKVGKRRVATDGKEVLKGFSVSESRLVFNSKGYKKLKAASEAVRPKPSNPKKKDE